MRILVIAAHPDDEVIGCGGTIARHVVSGDKVYLLVMTQIYAPEWNMKEFDRRRQEVFRVADILGIKEVFFGGFPTAKLNIIPTITLAAKISQLIKKIKPETIYLPPKEDLNMDHVIVCRQGIVACKGIDYIKRIVSYEVPTVFGYEDMKVNYYVDISQYFKKKILAMKAYRTEIKKYPHPRSAEGLTLLAQNRGMSVGIKYAEAFKIIREIIK